VKKTNKISGVHSDFVYFLCMFKNSIKDVHIIEAG